MSEQIIRCATIERARNSAIQWLEQLGVVFGPHRQIQHGNLERCAELYGQETGVSGNLPKWWRLRLDYDPGKGCHFNTEFGKHADAQKCAFLFPGGQELIAKLGSRRSPR